MDEDLVVDKAGEIGYNSIVDWEAYRSGHNEPHSKCGCPPGHVGSNPTASAKEKSVTKMRSDFFFMLDKTAHFIQFFLYWI